MAPPKGVRTLFVKFIVPLISTLALLILMHPPMFESNWLTPRKVSGERIVVITPLAPNRNKLDVKLPSFLFSLKWLSKYYSY